MTSQSGFTLLETVAASAISVIVGGAILSTLYMTNSQTKDGINKLQLSKYCIAVSQQIRSSGRHSFAVKMPGDAVGPLSGANLSDPLLVGIRTVFFCDAAGAIKSGYQIESSNFLSEWVAGSFVPFKFGTDTVKVNYSSSTFYILPRRRGVVFRLNYFRNDNGQSFQLPIQSETVICRNQNR